GSALFLLGDDLVFDLVVRRLRQHFLLHQLVLTLVRTVLDYFLGVRIADARQFLELFLRSAVNVDRLLLFRGLRVGFFLRRRRLLGGEHSGGRRCDREAKRREDGGDDSG